MKAAFATAIATCMRGWRETHGRAPTVHELVHAFEVCLSAGADEYCADPVAAQELFLPPSPPAKLSPAYSSRPAWVSYGGIEHLTLELVPPRHGSLRCAFEHAGDRLTIDYWMSIYPTPPVDADVRRYLLRHAVDAYRAKYPAHAVARVLIRSFETLADPVEVAV